jgi:coenzyme F420-reducing hydrogenase beta subunit
MFAAQAVDAQNSSSGGVFSALSKTVLNEGGVVYGVAMTSQLQTEYKKIEHIENLAEITGSKYIKASIDQTLFQSVIEDLSSGKIVVFSGIACQIAGLQQYLISKNINTSKLIIIEVVCHGTPYIETWKAYTRFLERKYKSKIVQVNFRDKKYGWKAYSMFVKFQNGKVYRHIMNHDKFMQLYLSGWGIAEGCTKCNFKRNRRNADITLGDMWGVNYDRNTFSINEGISLVSINSKRGMEIFNDSQPYIKKSQKLNYVQKVTALSNMMGCSDSISLNKKEMLMELIRSEGFEKAYKFFVKENYKYVLINNLKAIYKKSGYFRSIKRKHY